MPDMSRSFAQLSQSFFLNPLKPDVWERLVLPGAYCPIVVVRVTPSRARARESFMSMLMKLS